MKMEMEKKVVGTRDGREGEHFSLESRATKRITSQGEPIQYHFPTQCTKIAVATCSRKGVLLESTCQVSHRMRRLALLCRQQKWKPIFAVRAPGAAGYLLLVNKGSRPI